MKARKDCCGVCKGKMGKISIPSDELGPYLSVFIDGRMKLLGLPGKVSQAVYDQIHKAGLAITEVVPQQWGCPDCETIHTYWYRKDGKQGALFRMTKDRQKGKGRPLAHTED